MFRAGILVCQTLGATVSGTPSTEWGAKLTAGLRAGRSRGRCAVVRASGRDDPNTHGETRRSYRPSSESFERRTIPSTSILVHGAGIEPALPLPENGF